MYLLTLWLVEVGVAINIMDKKIAKYNEFRH